MVAWPRSARIPPPGLPMLPSNDCKTEAARIICTPVVCCVQPTAYTTAPDRSGPALFHNVSNTFRNVARGVPQTSSTISGVYR